MTDLPEPLVPPEIDLTKIDAFMLDTVRLVGSELVALSTGDEFKAAVLLWARAWHQRPAASLPDDDRVLASFAMVSLARWKKIKPMALRGFIKCSDGRLYHKVLAQDARKAWAKVEQRRAAIRARYEKPTAVDDAVDTDALREGYGEPTRDGTETGRKKEKKEFTTLESSAARAKGRAPGSLNGHATANPENRKAIWFQRVQAFVNAKLPAERAISLVARYLEGEAAAKREWEEWARLEKESRQGSAGA